jgi:hypothetical protein
VIFPVSEAKQAEIEVENSVFQLFFTKKAKNDDF